MHAQMHLSQLNFVNEASYSALSEAGMTTVTSIDLPEIYIWVTESSIRPKDSGMRSM